MATLKTPYYGSPEEAKALIAARDAFAFDEPREHPKFVGIIAGPEGVGKTHMACTASELGPVYLIDTEQRADFVVKKFKGKVKMKVARTYSEIVVAVKAIIAKCEPGTVVIDSGSDLQIFAEIAYLDRTKQEKIYPIFNWSEVWAMCNALVNDIKFAGHNLIVTARIKEEYVAEKSTGRWVPRIYDRLKYGSDFAIQFPREVAGRIQTLKNFDDFEYLPLIPRKSTISEVLNHLTKKGA